jgi:hypothetical protein
MDILLPQIYPIDDSDKYKLHLACWNGDHQPLDVFVNDRAEWDSWNAWRGPNNDFNRDFIFSLIDFYPEKDRWLFGGAYRVLSRRNIKHAKAYTIELMEESRPLIGRLKISLKRPSRIKSHKFEKHYAHLVVSEILPAPYSGEMFCGYDQIDIGFPLLQSIFAMQRSDWKFALENAKGVYLITDTSNGRRYVGSAYGGTGLWSRWSCYVKTGHGYTDELTRLIAKSGIEHARKYFRFSLLEHRTMKTTDDEIIKRETYWKDVLQTRGKYGYNKN